MQHLANWIRALPPRARIFIGSPFILAYVILLPLAVGAGVQGVQFGFDWPGVAIIALALLYPHACVLLYVLLVKISSAAKVSLPGGIALEARITPPEPEPGTRITTHHLSLAHTSFRRADLDQQHGHAVYQFEVILMCSGRVLESVDSVTYFLPKDWPAQFREARLGPDERRSHFKLKQLAWGDVFVRADVKVRDQDEVVPLSAYVLLNEVGRRI